MTDERCPSCNADLLGEPIPAEHQHHYGESTHYSNVIGVEVSGVYDGVLYWMCPLCNHRWHRFPEVHPLRAQAERFVSRTDGAAS